jgi:predicted DNA-binding transcriptional regulator AlpA
VPLLDDIVEPDVIAEKLAVKRTTLRDWRSGGVGPPYIKVGRQVRYSLGSVEGWLARQTVSHDRQPA